MVAIYYSISDRCYSQRDFYETFRKAVNAQSNIVIVSCILFCIATWIGYSDHACTVANNSTKKQLIIVLRSSSTLCCARMWYLALHSHCCVIDCALQQTVRTPVCSCFLTVENIQKSNFSKFGLCWNNRICFKLLTSILLKC